MPFRSASSMELSPPDFFFGARAVPAEPSDASGADSMVSVT